MAIREEYQQLEAEIKKEEKRRRKLDLISVGVLELDKAFISYAAWLYNKTGQDLKELIDTIILSFCEILEQEEKFINKSDIEDIIKRDKYQTLEAPLDTIYYVNFLLHIDFILTVLNHILKIRHSDPNTARDYDIKEKIRSTIKLCEDILAQCQNVDVDSIPFDIIKEYQLSSFPRTKDIFYDNYKDAFLTIKQTRGLSNEEFDSYFETLAEKSYYCVIYSRVILLIIYLLFFDDEPKYVVKPVLVSDDNENDFIQSSHTIEEIFNFLKKFPAVVIKNMFLPFKTAGEINLMQYSSIIDAIHTSDLNLFKSVINNDIASFLDNIYPIITIIYMISLMFSSNTDQELEMTSKYGTIILPRFASAFQFKTTNSTKFLNESSTPIDLQILELYINNSPVMLGYLAYFYKKHRQSLHYEDIRRFDTIFTQEPYKSYCDKALFELDKLYPNNKSFQDFWRILAFENNNQGHDETICNVPTENVSASELESKQDSNSKMTDNPFDGLNREADKQCSSDKKGYVSMFIDYLIYRGYIDAENKDAYVCCLCDDPIPDNTLEHLKYNIANKEGSRNANIVTLMFGRLTRFTANNQIVVDGKEISRGSIYFNKGQIDNGELEEWCLFWPFLKGRSREEFKKLFQSAMRSNESRIENAFNRVTSFTEDYEAAKQQNPNITKLDFIKMRHELH